MWGSGPAAQTIQSGQALEARDAAWSFPAVLPVSHGQIPSISMLWSQAAEKDVAKTALIGRERSLTDDELTGNACRWPAGFEQPGWCLEIEWPSIGETKPKRWSFAGLLQSSN